MIKYNIDKIKSEGYTNQTGDYLNTSSIQLSTPFTQSYIYGRWQESMGRKVIRFQISSAETGPAAYFQIITFPLAFGKNYLYIPYGPVLYTKFTPELNDQIRNIVREEMRLQNAVFARLDFTPSILGMFANSDANSRQDYKNDCKKYGYRLAPKLSTHSAYFQPRSEWLLDLEPSEEELLANMHEKTRYSIRLGYRKGIEHGIISADKSLAHMQYFDKFYKLMSDTAERNDFKLHQRKYYEAIFASLSDLSDLPDLLNKSTNTKTDVAFLSIAKYAGQILAIDLIIIHADVAYYMYGGSSIVERNRMPTYVAMWEAIKHAKSLGAKSYNFGAISNSNLDGTKDAWSGITEFKVKFGGQALRHGPLLDLVSGNLVDKALYWLYNIRKYIQSLRG